jgi:hypothetical protein
MDRHRCELEMRLKSALWVAAYIRRCQVEGLFAVVRRRGAEEAGAVFVRVSRLDGTSDLYGPAPQSAFDAAEGSARAFAPSLKALPAPDAEVEAYLAREVKFDSDVWIVELDDREGRNFLDIVVG